MPINKNVFIKNLVLLIMVMLLYLQVLDCLLQVDALIGSNC